MTDAEEEEGGHSSNNFRCAKVWRRFISSGIRLGIRLGFHEGFAPLKNTEVSTIGTGYSGSMESKRKIRIIRQSG